MTVDETWVHYYEPENKAQSRQSVGPGLDQLRTVIREKRRGKLSKGILLQQNNARVHTCKIAMNAVEPNWYELIPHPTYSPDLAPSDYFLFPNLKKDIRGRHFRSNEDVVAAVD